MGEVIHIPNSRWSVARESSRQASEQTIIHHFSDAYEKHHGLDQAARQELRICFELAIEMNELELAYAIDNATTRAQQQAGETSRLRDITIQEIEVSHPALFERISAYLNQSFERESL